ncbi:ribosome small subunit-dependent GTPase A [Serinibacter salmoneus]|uniref:Small ribosomal subunit biogenesis GTPase RsgA n=1 Tax=Serinibacter salmoneus TaxID=556530 RepID=A0A2A9D3A2_9MICO|nr:ribosome small subunit-dependent GTPase A [Serinibacter salmoneus]PFG20319.1 ribosome biogenesis GTPase [Serinibacter salmoneus]
MREFDESDVRIRPRRGGTKPRSKRRPEHAEAQWGTVTTIDRGRYDVLLPQGGVRAVTARELGRGAVVVGDRVAVVGDTSGRAGTLARIVRVAERTSLLRRTSEDTGGVERALVANADQMVIVTALADPTPRTRMVDRCLVAAYDAGMDALLCLTKADLAPPADFLANYEPLGVRWVSSARTDGEITGLTALREALADRTSVLVGHSGVGKSTLVNALVPNASRRVGDVNAVTGRGRHTSTSALLLELPGGGWVIDTPGVRSFGLAHVEVADVVGAFGDLAEITTACPPGCTHLSDAPGCALTVYLRTATPLGADRVASLRRLLASRSGESVSDTPAMPHAPIPGAGTPPEGTA